jgi:hypothetical protein
MVSFFQTGLEKQLAWTCDSKVQIDGLARRLDISKIRTLHAKCGLLDFQKVQPAHNWFEKIHVQLARNCFYKSLSMKYQM